MTDNVTEFFNVDKIVGHQVRDGKTVFRVRWEGYNPKDDTWEPYENVHDCVAFSKYQAEQRRNAGKQAPEDVGLPDYEDSGDSDATAAIDSRAAPEIILAGLGQHSRIDSISVSKDVDSSATVPKDPRRASTTTREDVRPSSSGSKQVTDSQNLQPVVCIDLSSDSDDDIFSVMVMEDSYKTKEKPKGKATENHKISGTGKQRKSDLQSGSCSTSNTASAMDPRVSKEQVRNQSDTLNYQSSSKMGSDSCGSSSGIGEKLKSKIAHSTTAIDEPRESMDDLTDQLLESSLSVYLDVLISCAPHPEKDPSYSKALDKTTNPTGSNTSGSQPTKTDDQSTGPEHKKLPPPIRQNLKMKTKPNEDKLIASDEDIQSLHNYVKEGKYQDIQNWYSTPGRKDWELVNRGGSTILMQAGVNGRVDIMNFLLVNGADVNAQQKVGRTTVMLLCKNVFGHPNEQMRLEMVNMLIAFGANLNMLDFNGETALMMACRSGYCKIVKCLLDSGVDFYMRTKTSQRTFGKRMAAVDFAKTDSENNPLNSKEHLEIVEMISTLEDRMTAAFEAQIQLVLNDSAKLLDPLFDTTIFSLCEGTKFTLFFRHKTQQYDPDMGLLLFVAHALISVDGEIQCRVYGDVSAVSAIRLNGIRLKGITEADHVLSFCPVQNGINRLELDTMDMKNSDVKLIVRAHKVQLLP